ncbi:MAG: 16S rRNA (adenine(1518)-N(6)/adenine(1519)-N(6))-dimethyltransferase RsmA [Gammaproteobacteria bacterium]
MTVRRKRFGQHFLVDDYVIGRIVELIQPMPGEPIVEIGPGGGVLTAPLLDAGAALTAIEIDRDLAGTLERQFAARPNFTLVTADVLSVDFAALTAGRRGWKLVGNLPYNISTPLILKLLEAAVPCREMIFMLQREVADRLAAPAGGRAYGRLSVMTQRRAAVELCLDVPPACFDPPPKVDSAVVRLRPLARELDPAHERRLGTIVRAAFSRRRKTIANALKDLVTREQIAAAGIDPGLRAEALEPCDFDKLAGAVEAAGE